MAQSSAGANGNPAERSIRFPSPRSMTASPLIYRFGARPTSAERYYGGKWRAPRLLGRNSGGNPERESCGGRTRISLHGAMPYHLPSWLFQPRTDRTFSASSRSSRRQSLPNGSCDSYRIRLDLAGGRKSGKRIADPSHLVKFHTGQSGCWQTFGFAYTFPRS